MQLSWQTFEINEPDIEGIRLKFEHLCRQLFVNENICGNKRFRYPHADPQNPGLETEPIYDEKNHRKIGFQAKYYTNTVDYNDIINSAQMVIKHYAGKVEHVFLFCNKKIKNESKGIQTTIEILQTENITLELITNDIIFDIVRRYPYLVTAYFGIHSIPFSWFITHSEQIFDEIGNRFNREFNVATNTALELSLFVQDNESIGYINNKKTNLYEEILRQRNKCDDEAEYLYITHLHDILSSIAEINQFNIINCFDWINIVIESIKKDISVLQEKKKRLSEEMDGLLNVENVNRAKISYIQDKIQHINILLSLPEMVEISSREKNLILDKQLFIQGNAGSGKTQIIANQTQRLLAQNREVLFLIGGIYYSNNGIIQQIEEDLNLRISFDEVLDILETIGECKDQIVPVFIDAINETYNWRLWKIGLPALMQKINDREYLKLVITYRPEYQKGILNEHLQKRLENEEIISIIHNGFIDNSVEATKQFLDHYGIPFTPFAFFSKGMTNPLFLTMYCRTYDGEDVELPSLYERIIKTINKSLLVQLKEQTRVFTDSDDILTPLIKELSQMMLGKSFVLRTDLEKMKYWDEYGLNRAEIIHVLKKEGLLHSHVNGDDDEEIYYFAFDQMNDYFGAQAVIKKYKTKKDIKKYTHDIVLDIKDGQLQNWRIGLFVHICACYADKFHEECIDIIDDIKDEYQRREVLEQYIATFQWRKTDRNAADHFIENGKKYHICAADLWDVLICNSIKENNPLNADMLHDILTSYDLPQRDYLWTIYINGLLNREDDRLIHLIELYEKGEEIGLSKDKQLELLLVLFSWLLSSSNRWLRDHVSKAMVEILKRNLQLCVLLLKKHEKTNDPYVLQRLYGIVFGALCTSDNGNEDTDKELAEYVYSYVFDQEMVYPDILLRDYARMTIELFLHRNLSYTGVIIHEKIIPPYRSVEIPDIAEQKYEIKDYENGISQIIHSMRFDGMGTMYGDFGRYVFQSAIHNFKVDDKKIYNYAMYFILNELGYKDELFAEYDYYGRGQVFDRHQTIKCERIGKKYQWITMYNILARISDQYKIYDRYTFEEPVEKPYSGPWEPFVRDFDPTLNYLYLNIIGAPLLNELSGPVNNAREEFACIDKENNGQMKQWLTETGKCFDNLADSFILQDNNDNEWIALYRYVDTGTENLKVDKCEVWFKAIAVFVNDRQKKQLCKACKKGVDIATSSNMTIPMNYESYHGEYPWAPSCEELKKNAWTDFEINTGRTKTVMLSVPEYKVLDDDVEISNEEDAKGKLSIVIKYHDVEMQEPIYENTGDVLKSVSELRWECRYDATLEESITRYVPCYDIITKLHLKQGKHNCVYYDTNNDVAAFDAKFGQSQNCLVIRKDLLNTYLEDSRLSLLWLVQAEKEYHPQGIGISKYSNWEGVYTYNGKTIKGRIKNLETISE